MCCDESLYPYEPSKVAPIIFLVAFLLSTLHHIWLNVRYRSWRVTGTLPWGGIVFIAGFAVREVSAFYPKNLNLFIASAVLILVAPPVYALLNYIVLGRVLYYVPQLSPIHPGRVITTFCGLDVVVGILTGNGGARVANVNATPADINAGKGLLRASILLQLVAFFLFVLLEYVFHRRCINAGTLDSKDTANATKNANRVRGILYLMYISSVIISSRHVFRVVDVFQGNTGYLEQHEWPLYVFDGAFMFVNALMLNIWHPMKYLPNDNMIYLSRDGTTERLGPGWEDSRPFLITLLDPFDIAGIFMKRDKDVFWDHEDEHPIVGQDTIGMDRAGEAASAA
ncbi:MAG: hypothetical protein LQ348_003187 [Seirophora lacunosa]|nr:MAG: hypothetical protein LQ348_003187 [Seirophora lacunosa]